MDIALYIAELLQQHDEVCVSGLGTFYKKTVQGYFDNKENVYYPPSEKAVFENNFRTDTKLSEHISEVKNISTASSNYFIEKFAGAVLRQLNDTGTADISPLGVLRKQNMEYQFLANPDLQLGHKFYGLKPAPEYQKARGFSPSEVGHNQQITYREESQEENLMPEEVPQRSRVGLWIAATIVILLLIATGVHLWKPELIQQIARQVPIKAAKPVPSVQAPRTEKDSLATADSIVKALKDQGFEVDTPRDTIDVSVKAQPVTRQTFEIIAASLNRQSDAETIAKAFKAKGIDARIILAKEKKKNNILISLASFPDRLSAQKELMRIKKDIEPGAYIYDFKNQ